MGHTAFPYAQLLDRQPCRVFVFDIDFVLLYVCIHICTRHVYARVCVSLITTHRHWNIDVRRTHTFTIYTCMHIWMRLRLFLFPHNCPNIRHRRRSLVPYYGKTWTPTRFVYPIMPNYLHRVKSMPDRPVCRVPYTPVISGRWSVKWLGLHYSQTRVKTESSNTTP